MKAKEKLFKYLLSFPNFSNMWEEINGCSKLKRYIKLLKNIPCITWIILTGQIIRKRQVKKLLSNDSIFHLEKYNIDMYLPNLRIQKGNIVGDYIQKIIFLSNDFYEIKELLYIQRKYLFNVKNMIDVGANIGNHTLFYSCVAKFEKVFSFEPVADTFAILEKNIKINKLHNVNIYNIGLGEREANADILLRKTNNCGATQLEYSDNGDLHIKALDQFDFNCHIDYVKIDVEGFENDVLKGAKLLILKDKPIIFMEIFPENYEKVNKIMKEYNYYCKEDLDGANYIYLPLD